MCTSRSTTAPTADGPDDDRRHRPPAPVRDRRRPEGRDDGAARGAGHAPGAVPLAGQGAEVLPDRRPAAAAQRPARPGRRAQRAGVDLAARGVPRAVRRRAGRHGPRGEHAVLPLRPGGAGPAGRRRPRTSRWSSSSATRSTAPTRTGRTCAPTGSSPRPTSPPRSGWRSSGSPTAGRRSGTTAGWAATASSCATCYRHVPREQVLPAALPPARRHPAGDAGPGQRLPRRGRGRGAHRRPGEREAVRRRHRRGTALLSRVGPRRCGARRARPAAGLAPGVSAR